MSVPIDLLATLRSGLPGAAGPPRHVVIVGAGIGGFAGGMYGELGAMRFPRQHRLGQHLIHERFKLATTPFPMYGRGHLHPS